MSEPKRYTCKVWNTCCDRMDACLADGDNNAPEGEYIRYEDYARLKEDAERYRLASLQGDVARLENARLKAECQARQAENSVLAVECDSLKAEVERMTERNKYLEQIDSYLQDGINIANEERCIELEAQVERLTKAGDAMAKLLSCCGNPQSEVRGWHAAKGVQS